MARPQIPCRRYWSGRSARIVQCRRTRRNPLTQVGEIGSAGKRLEGQLQRIAETRSNPHPTTVSPQRQPQVVDTNDLPAAAYLSLVWKIPLSGRNRQFQLDHHARLNFRIVRLEIEPARTDVASHRPACIVTRIACRAVLQWQPDGQPPMRTTLLPCCCCYRGHVVSLFITGKRYKQFRCHTTKNLPGRRQFSRESPIFPDRNRPARPKTRVIHTKAPKATSRARPICPALKHPSDTAPAKMPTPMLRKKNGLLHCGNGA